MRRLLRIFLIYTALEAVGYLRGWTRVPLQEPQKTHFAWFFYQVVSGYPPGELNHWDGPVPRFKDGIT